MPQIILETDTFAQAQFLSAFLKNVKIVKSVSIEPDKNPRNVVKEPAEEYNWTNPTRPATNEEFEQMISEAEKEIELGLGIPASEARKQTMQKIKTWKRKRL
jgi:hypothetical protein